MDERLFINLSPGHTYLDRLTGKTKVRLFFAFIILLIATPTAPGGTLKTLRKAPTCAPCAPS